MAEDKFAESLQLAQMGMHNLLENDVSTLHVFTIFSLLMCLNQFDLSLHLNSFLLIYLCNESFVRCL